MLSFPSAAAEGNSNEDTGKSAGSCRHEILPIQTEANFAPNSSHPDANVQIDVVFGRSLITLDVELFAGSLLFCLS